jgi:hypothetical protein
MMSTYTYTFRSQDGAEEKIAGKELDELVPRHHGFFCTCCGRMWASVLSDSLNAFHDIHAVNCLSHRNKDLAGSRPLAGSILNTSGYPDGNQSLHQALTLANLPDAVVKLEFIAHLTHYEEHTNVYKESNQQDLCLFDS